MSLSSYDVHKLDHISFHELHTYIHTHTHTHPHTPIRENVRCNLYFIRVTVAAWYKIYGGAPSGRDQTN